MCFFYTKLPHNMYLRCENICDVHECCSIIIVDHVCYDFQGHYNINQQCYLCLGYCHLGMQKCSVTIWRCDYGALNDIDMPLIYQSIYESF